MLRPEDVLLEVKDEPKFSFDEALKNSTLNPHDQLACFDSLFFAGATETYEWEHISSPAWNVIGTHLRFSQGLEDITMEYLRKIFGVNTNAQIPPVRAPLQRDCESAIDRP